MKRVKKVKMVEKCEKSEKHEKAMKKGNFFFKKNNVFSVEHYFSL